MRDHTKCGKMFTQFKTRVSLGIDCSVDHAVIFLMHFFKGNMRKNEIWF